MTEVIETLNKMKDILLEDGWCKTVLQDNEGRVCLVGARNKVLGYPMGGFDKDRYQADYVSDRIESVLPAAYRRMEDRNYTLTWDFNDQASSINEVLDAIDQAIIAEKGA